MTAEGAGACYRLDVSNVSISIYGVILTPTPRTVKVYGRPAILLLQCTMYFKESKKTAIFIIAVVITSNPTSRDLIFPLINTQFLRLHTSKMLHVEGCEGRGKYTASMD
jgi:hypothetical protein